MGTSIKEYIIKITAEIGDAQSKLDQLAKSAEKIDKINLNLNIEKAFNQEIAHVTGALGKLKQTLNNMEKDAGKTKIDSSINEMASSFKEAADSIKTAVEELNTTFNGLKKNMAGLSENDLFRKPFSDLTEQIKDMMRAYKDAMNMVNNIMSGAVDMGAFTSSGAKGGISSSIAGAMTQMTDDLSKAVKVANKDVDKIVDDLGEIGKRIASGLKNFTENRENVLTAMNNAEDDSFSIADKFRAQLSALQIDIRDYNELYKELDETTHKKLKLPTVQDMFRNANVDSKSIRDFSGTVNDYIDTQFNNIEEIADARDRKAASSSGTRTKKKIVIPLDVVINPGQYDTKAIDSMVEEIQSKIQEKVQRKLAENPIKIPIAFSSAINQEGLTDEEIDKHFKGTGEKGLGEIIRSLKLQLDVETTSLTEKINGAIDELNGSGAINKIKVDIEPRDISQKAINNHAALVEDQIRRNNVSTDGVIPVSGGTTQIAGGTTSVSGGAVTVNGSPVYVNGSPVFVGGEAISGAVGSIAKDIGQIAGQMVSGGSGDQKKGESSTAEKGIKPTRFYNPIERMQSSPALESYTKLRQSTRAALAAAQLEQKGVESLISLIKKPGATIADLEKSDIYTDTYLYDGKEYAKYGSTREPIEQFRRNLISLFNEGKKQIAQAVGNINTQFSESALGELVPYRGDPRYQEFKSAAERTQASYEILKDKIEQAEEILTKGDMSLDEQEKLREDIKEKKTQLPEFKKQAEDAKTAFADYLESSPLVGQWKNVVAEAFTEQRNKATKDKAAAKKYLEKHNLTDRLTEGSNPIDVVNTYFNEQEDALRSAKEITPEYKKIIKKQYEDAVKKATNSIVKDVQINLNEDIEAIDAQLESLKKERGSKQDYLRGLKRLESTYKSMGQSMHDLYKGMIDREEANIGEVIKGIDGQISGLQSQRRQLRTTLNQDKLGSGQTNQTLSQKSLRIKNRIKTLAGTLNALGVDTDTITGEIQLDESKIGGTTKDVRKEINDKVAKLVEERNKKIDIQRERQDQSYRFLDFAKRGTPLTDRERAELESLETRKDQLSNREKARYERLSKRETPLSEDEQKEFEELKGILEDRIALAEYEEKHSELIAKAKTSLGTIHSKISKGQKLTRQDKLFLSDEDAEKITDPQELIDIAERIINPEDIVVTARSMDELRSFASDEIGKAKGVIKGLRQETDAKIAGAIIKSSSKYVNDGVFGANSKKTGREADYSLVVDDKNTYEQLKEDLKKYDEILSEYEPLIRAKDGSEGGLDFDALTRTQKKHYLDIRGLRKQAIMRIQAYETLNDIKSSPKEVELKNVNFAGLNLDRAGADIYKSLYERKANISNMSSEELRAFLADLQTVQTQLSAQQGEGLTEDQMKTRAVEMVQADIEYEKQRLQELDQMFPILDAMIDKYEQGISLAKENGIKTGDLYKEQNKVKAMKADAIKEYGIREQTINDLETNRENYAVVWQDGKKVFKQPSQIEETLRDLDESDADIAEQIQGMVGLSAEETDNFVSLLRDYEVSRDFEVQALKNLNNARRHESDVRKNLKGLENQNQRAEAVLQNALNEDQTSIDKADEIHQQYIQAKAEVDIAEQTTKNAQQIYSKAQRDTKKAFGKITAKYGKQRQAINEMIGNVSYALPQELMDKYQITGDIMENIEKQFAKIQDYDDFDNIEAAQTRIDVRQNIQKLLPEASESDITDILNNMIVNRDPSEQVAGLITQLNQNRLSREQLLNFQDRIKKKNINTNGALQKRISVYVKQQKDAQKQLDTAISAVEGTISEVNARIPEQEGIEAKQHSEEITAAKQAGELAKAKQEKWDLFTKLVGSQRERNKYWNEYYDKRIAEEDAKVAMAEGELQNAEADVLRTQQLADENYSSAWDKYIDKRKEYYELIGIKSSQGADNVRTLNEMIDAIPSFDPNKNRYLVAQKDLTKQQKIIDNTKNPDAKKKAREGLFPLQKKLNTTKNALINDIARGLEQEIDSLISELQDAVNKDDKGATVRIANALKAKLAEINKEEFIRSRIPGTDATRGLYMPSQKIAGKSVQDYVDYTLSNLDESIQTALNGMGKAYSDATKTIIDGAESVRQADKRVTETADKYFDTITAVNYQKEMHASHRADDLAGRFPAGQAKTDAELREARKRDAIMAFTGLEMDDNLTIRGFYDLARITGAREIMEEIIGEKIEEAQESPKKSATSEQKSKSKLNSGVQEKTESDKNAEADMIRTGIAPVKSSIIEKETEQIKDNTKATKENTKAKKGQKKAAEEAAKATVTESKSTSKTKSSDQISDFRASYARATTQDDRDAIVKEALASGYYVGKSETNEGKYSFLKNKKDGAISSYEDYLKERPVITNKPAKKEKTTEESKEVPKKETGKKAKTTTAGDTKATIREQIKDAIANAISQDEVDSAIKQAFEQGFGVNKNDKNKSYYITKEPSEKSLKDYEQYLAERQELDNNYFMKNLRKQGNAKLFAATSPEEYNGILKEYVGKGLKLLKNEDSGRITLTAGTGANEELTQELLTNGSIKIDLDFSAKKGGAKQAAEDVGDVKKQADEATTAVIDLKNALADMQSILSSSGEKGLTDSLKALKLDELRNILKNLDNKLGSTKVSGLRKPELIKAIVEGVKNSVAETPQNKRDQVINELLARKQAGEELSAVEESILQIAGSMKETQAIIDEVKSAEDSKPKSDSKKTSKQTAKQLRAKYYNATSQEEMDNVIKQAFESGYGVAPKENGLYSISNKPTNKQVKDYETYLAERADNTETMALKNLATEGNRKYHNAKTDQEKAEILRDYVSKGLHLMEQEVPATNKNGKPNKNAGQKKYVLSATGNISGTDITDSFAKDNNITIKMTTEPKPTTTTPSQTPEPSSVNSVLESVATSGEQAATSEERVATAGDAAADALGKVAGAASGVQGQGQPTGDQSPISSGTQKRFYRGVSSYDDGFLGGGVLTHEGHTYGSSSQDMILESGYAGMLGKLYEFEIEMSNKILEIDAAGKLSTEFEYLGNGIDADSQKLQTLVSNMKEFSDVSLIDVESLWAIDNLSQNDFEKYYNKKIEGILKPEGMPGYDISKHLTDLYGELLFAKQNDRSIDFIDKNIFESRGIDISSLKPSLSNGVEELYNIIKQIIAINQDSSKLLGYSISGLEDIPGASFKNDDFAKKAAGMGYDAVIFKNMMDSLELDYNNAVSDVIAVFNDKIIKTVKETKLDDEGELIASSTRLLSDSEWRKSNETPVLANTTTQQPETPNETPLPVIKLGEASESTTDSLETLGKATDDTTDELNQNAVVYKKSPVEWLDYIDASKDMAEAQHRMVEAIEDNIHFSYSDKYRDFYMTRGISKNADHVDITEQLKTNKTMREQFLSAYDNDKSGEFIDSLKGKNGVKGAADNASASLDGVTGSLNNVGEAADGLKKKTEENAKKPEVSKLAEMPKPTEESKPAEKSVEKPVEKSSETPKEVSTLQPIRNTKKPTIKSKTSAEIEKMLQDVYERGAITEDDIDVIAGTLGFYKGDLRKYLKGHSGTRKSDQIDYLLGQSNAYQTLRGQESGGVLASRNDSATRKKNEEAIKGEAAATAELEQSQKGVSSLAPQDTSETHRKNAEAIKEENNALKENNELKSQGGGTTKSSKKETQTRPDSKKDMDIKGLSNADLKKEAEEAAKEAAKGTSRNGPWFKYLNELWQEATTSSRGNFGGEIEDITLKAQQAWSDVRKVATQKAKAEIGFKNAYEDVAKYFGNTQDMYTFAESRAANMAKDNFKIKSPISNEDLETYRKMDEAIGNMESAWKKLGETGATITPEMEQMHNSFMEFYDNLNKYTDERYGEKISGSFKSFYDSLSWQEQVGNSFGLEKLGNTLSDLDKQFQNGAIDAKGLESGIKGAYEWYDKYAQINKAFGKNGMGTRIGEVSNAESAREFAKSYIQQRGYKQLTDLKGSVDMGNGEAINTFTAKVINAKGEVEQLKFAYSEFSNEVRVGGTVLEDAQSGFQRLFNSITGKAKQLATYWTAQLFNPYMLIRKFKEVINTVKELDTALTEMRKVSDESYSTLKDFASGESFDIAKESGSTAKQIMQSTADFMRIGESFEEAKKSAKTANVLLNVSEFQDINAATEALTAMSQAYKELEKTEITDKLNYIGNNYSISTSELAQSLQKSAGTLKVAGNTFDEAVALTVAGNQVLQDPLTVGQSLKTISMRLNGTSVADMQEAGEEIDGLITTKSKLQKTIKDLTKVKSNGYQGVDILDANGNYKTTYENLLAISEVFKEIGEEDKKFGTNRQNGLLETIAGKTRAAAASSILSNPDVLRDVLSDSMYNSYGSAEHELDAYLDSVQGKITQFQNSTQELTSNIIDNDFLKDIISMGTGAVNVINTLADSFGGLNVVIGAIGGILMQKNGLGLLFNKDASGKLGGFGTGLIPKIKSQIGEWKSAKAFIASEKSSVNNLVQNLGEDKNIFELDAMGLNAGVTRIASLQNTGFTKGFAAYVDQLDPAIAKTKTLAQLSQDYFATLGKQTGILSKIGGIFSSFVSTMGSMALVMAASYTLGKVLQGAEYLIHYKDHKIEEGKEAKERIDQINKEQSARKDFVDNNLDRYFELRKGVSGTTNRSLPTEDYAEFIDLNNQLANQFPQLVSGYDTQGNALLNLSDNINTASTSIKNLLDQEQLLADFNISKNLQDLVTGAMFELEDLQDDFDSLSNAQEIIESITKKKPDLSNIGFDENGVLDFFIPENMEGGDEIATRILNAYREAATSAQVSVESMVYDNINQDGEIGIRYVLTPVADDQRLTEFKDSMSNFVDSIQAEYSDDLAELTMDNALQMNYDKTEMKATWNKLVPSMLSAMNLYDDYRKLGDSTPGQQIQKIISDDITNIDLEQLFNDEKSLEQFKTTPRKFLREKFLDPIMDAISDEDGNIEEPLLDKLNNMISFDDSQLTIGEYNTKVQEMVQDLVGDDIEAQQDLLVLLNIKYKENGFIGDSKTKEALELSELTGIKYQDIADNMKIGDIEYVLSLPSEDFDFQFLKNNNISPVEQLQNWISQNQNKNTVQAGSSALSDILNDETFQTDTSKTESHISALSSALDNFRESGELTTEQLHDLQKEVPELAELGDSLTMEDVGDKLWENIGDYATKFHEAMDRMDLSDEGKTQAQNYLNSFFDQFADIPVREKNAQKALHDFFVNTEATSAETAAQRGVEENRYKKAIDALHEKYGDDIDWSVVMSILADPSLAEAETQEFIDTVDTQEATVKIRADIEQAKADLDKFVENAEADISAQEAYIARKQAKGSTDEFGYDFREASVNGTDLSNTVFGNIDVSDRQVIKWTPEALHKNRDILKQWEYSPKPGTSSTIMGDYRTYDGLGVAFSPMLQTDHGAEILSPDTIDKYIGSLLSEVQRSHPDSWNTEDLLTLDSRGLVIDGKKIKNIIADVGETAEETSRIMHEVGAPFTETGEFRVTKADYEPIIQRRRDIANETASHYQYLLGEYDNAKEQGATKPYLHDLSKQIADAQADMENRQADLYNAERDAREADLNWYNTMLENHKAIGEDLESERTILENNGKVVTNELAQEIAGNRRSQIQAQQTVLNENNRLYENTGEIQYLQNMVAARNAIEDIKSLGMTADQVIWESQVSNLDNSLTALEATATTIQDAITLQEGQGLKPTIDQYQRLVKNGKDQVANLEKQNYYLSRQQNRLTVNSARWREIGAQINSNNSAIASMNGNINSWQDNLRSFAGDMGQSLLSALQAAFDESNSPTGLQFSTMKELAAQFEGIEGFDFADIFYNTAQGVKLDADATERLVDAQYQLMTGDLTKRINSQNAALQNLRQTYRETTDASEKANLSMQIDAGEANLNNMYNQLAQYQALYSQAQRQLFSDYGAWQRAQSSENAGATYSSIQGYLATQEQAYKDGLIGTDEFKTYTALFDQWGRDTLKAYTENREKMQRYLTEDASGVANVLTDLVETGFASYDEDTMAYSFNISDMKQAASSIGVSKEFLDYALQRTEDYGFTNDYVRDQIQGELKLSDLVQQTGEAIKKRNELIADGAPQEVIDEYNDKIAQLDQSTENVEKNIQTVVANAGKISASEVKAAVDTINEYKKRANEATTDQQREAYMRQIQNVADEAGIELDELGGIDYKKLNKQYAGWYKEKNAKAVSDITDEQVESVKLEDKSLKNNEAIQAGLGKIKDNWEANKDSVQDYVDILKGANVDDLMGLDLNDKKTVAGLEKEENALDALAAAFGLAGDEANALMPFLKEIGLFGEDKMYNKPGAQGTLGVDVGAAQNYLEAHSAIGLTADDLVFDAANMSLDELQSKMDQLSQAKGMVRIEEQGGPEALAQLEQLEAECQKEYNIKVGIQNLNEMGMSIDEFLGKSKDEQIEIMAKLGIEEENYDAFVARIESNPVRAKIETALSDGSKSVEDLIGLTDEELIAEVGCEASEVDEVRAELEEMAANEYDVKVAINDASIAEIGKSIVAALNGQEYKKDVTLEAKGQDKVQSEAEKPATKKVNIVYEVVQKARDFVGGVVGAVSNFFGGGSKQTASASLDTTAATTALNALKAEASNIPVKLNIDGAVGQIDSLKSSLDEIRNSDPIQIEANNDDAIHKIEDVKSKAESANPKIKIGGENDQAKSSIDQVVALANRSVGRIKISADRAQATSAVSAAVSYANGRTAKIKIGGDTSDAISAANDAVARIRRMIANISINANVRATVTGTVVRPTRPSATPSRPSGHTNTHINDSTHYNTEKYSGTLSSIGRGYAKGTFDEDGKVAKSGSAYNMLNYKDMSGYARGDVAIDKDQESLVNELGVESIIRNGRWFLVPGGPHIENLKRGDIVLIMRLCMATYIEKFI